MSTVKFGLGENVTVPGLDNAAAMIDGRREFVGGTIEYRIVIWIHGKRSTGWVSANELNACELEGTVRRVAPNGQLKWKRKIYGLGSAYGGLDCWVLSNDTTLKLQFRNMATVIREK